MNKCTYCGKEYPDDALVCALDHTPLQAEAAVPGSYCEGANPPVSSADAPPALWNPNAAANWSLLFSPAFGAFLHARNADTLGRRDEARQNRVWFHISFAFLVLAVVTSFFPVIPDGIFTVAGLALLLGWYFSLGKKQARYVKDTWQKRYQRKPWAKPLFVAFCCVVGMFAGFCVLGAIAASLFALQ